MFPHEKPTLLPSSTESVGSSSIDDDSSLDTTTTFDMVKSKSSKLKQSSIHQIPPAPPVDDAGPPKHLDDAYTPPPAVTSSQILSAGLALYVLSCLWRPFVLIVACALAQFLPYCHRINDDAGTRRKLLTEFDRNDQENELRMIPDNVQITERYWASKRGTVLFTSLMVPKDQPVRCVACFCHGYTDNAHYSKRKELTRLVQNGIAVAMIDYEGHGRSDGTLGLISDWNVMVGDVKEYFVDQVQNQDFGDNDVPFFLMGESMGGAVAYTIYNMVPKNTFRGIVFQAPMCKISPNMLPPQWVIDLGRMITETLEFVGTLPIAPGGGNIGDYTYQIPDRRWLHTRPPSLFGRRPRMITSRELLNVTQHISNNLHTFDAPFLIQHGEMDKVTDPELSKALYQESCSSDKSLKLYSGMWHCLMNGEPDPNVEMVMNDTIQWMLERSTE